MVTRKCLKISCAISVILLLVIVGVVLTLYFTILKPKQPIVIPQPVTLLHLHFALSPLELNLTLGLTITVDNRNYGSFTYPDSMVNINYQTIEVAKALLAADTIPARAKHNISTSVDVFGDRLVTNMDFIHDFLGGVVNFTSSTALHGEVKVLNFIKKKATSYTTCDISISFKQRTTDSVCKSKLKL